MAAAAAVTARRFAAACAGLLAGAALAWAAGFAWFVHAAHESGASPPHADAIVALTGGAERVETALRLLAGGSAPLLLVSGVGQRADLPDLARRVGLNAGSLAGHVTLGREAMSTWGNAAETAQWARTHDARSLIVVTAGYHMPRALVEISRALPDVALYPVPVVPPALRGASDAATLRLLAGEFNKLLVAWTGLSRLWQVGEHG